MLAALIAIAVLQQPAASNGAITVKVLERSTDAPLAGVWVSTRIRRSSDEPRTAETGPDGTVTISELPAGSYDIQLSSGTHLAAEPHGLGSAPVAVAKGRTSSITFRMARGGVISGQVTNNGAPLRGGSVSLVIRMRDRILDHVVVEEGRHTKTDEQGRFWFTGLYRHTYLLKVRFGEFSGVYYPGTVDVERAAAIVVGLESNTDLSMEYPNIPTVAVTGRVIDESGGGRRELISRRLHVDTGHTISNELVSHAADGSFILPRQESGVRGLLYTRHGTDGDLLAAAAKVIRVGIEAVSGLELRARPPASMSGVFVFPNGSHDLDLYPPPGVHLRPEGEDRLMRERLARNGDPDEANAFRIKGIVGRHRVDVQEPDGWLIDAVLLSDGRNILDTVVEFEPGKKYDAVRVVLSDQAARIRGSMDVNSSRAPPGMMAVAFPEDESLWRFWRNLRFAHVDETGAFVIETLRPGLTYLVATCRWPCNTGYEGENLKLLSKSAKRLFVDRPATFTVDFRNP